MQTPIEDNVQNVSKNVVKVIKNRMFDFIAAGIVIAMLVLNLGVIELREITFISLLNILLETIPFFLCSVLLSVNFYNKGSFSGKNTQNFKLITKQYSDIVTDLTGEEIDVLPEFCQEYNDKALMRLQSNMLRRAAISYERFNNVTKDKKGDELQPLKVLTEQELKKLYSDERVAIIQKAKHIKIKGINDNVLLSSMSTEDISDIGKDEKELSKENAKKSIVIYLSSTIVLSLIGVKDVLLWGWAGLLIIAFKLIYILCSSAMKHFKGYNDVTIKLANHIARKTDILKQFKYWKSNKNVKTEE